MRLTVLIDLTTSPEYLGGCKCSGTVIYVFSDPYPFPFSEATVERPPHLYM